MSDLESVESLLESWKSKVINTEIFYDSVKSLVLKDYYSENKTPFLISSDKNRPRPLISGVLLKQLENWVNKNLIVKESAVGELTKDLFNDYESYIEFMKFPEIISRKSFSISLHYYLQTSKNAYFVSYTPGRNGFFIGVELKSQKKIET
jgi:hypothetical protein